MNMVRKVVSGVLAVCMVGSMGLMSAFAAPSADGDYTGTVTFLHETKDQPSMCNALFDHTADVTISDGQATVTVYTANPVPAFPDQGADGTVKNVKVTLGDQQYDAVSDMESKIVREFDETNALFGLNAGESYPTQKLSFTVPVAGLSELETGAKTDAYVNVVMMTDVIFRLQLTGLTPVSAPVLPDETREQSMNVTADIAAPQATYSVTIPESIAMGTLSTEEDTVTAYTVNVTAENLGDGRVEVSAPASGVLTSGENSLAYTNSFGAQQTSVSTELAGSFSVSSADVAAAAAGNYTGTATFSISYYAGK